MHGLVNRAIEGFVRGCYGPQMWHDIAREAGLGFDEFEAMLHYDDALTDRVLERLADRLDQPVPMILENLGHYLVADPKAGAVRRLLRFGGAGFVDFLHSLDDLPDRARLAVDDLELPELVLHTAPRGRFSLICRGAHPGYPHVMIGILRAMADDYGSLATIEDAGPVPGGRRISVALVETAFAEARAFDLGGAERSGP